MPYRATLPVRSKRGAVQEGPNGLATPSCPLIGLPLGRPLGGSEEAQTT